jgi:hypothetical protein
MQRYRKQGGRHQPGYRPGDKGATAFPASIVVGAGFNPQLACDGDAAIGREARMRGFNIMLTGGKRPQQSRMKNARAPASPYPSLP